MSERAFTFPSLTRPEYAYTLYRYSNFWQDRHRMLSSSVGEFRTYGDGLTQHSGEYATDREHFEDYLASLAAFLLTGENVLKYAEALKSMWPEHTDHKSIDFALSVAYDSAKRNRYYSKQERKISSSRSKQYDKRWEEIPEWADGSVESAFRILVSDYMDLLERYVLYVAIRNRDGSFAKHPAVFFKIGKSGDEYAPDLTASQAFETVDALARAARALDSAKRQFNSYTHNAGLNQPKQIEAADDAA